MTESRVTLRTIQAVGLTAIGMTTGYSFALSQAVVPRLLESPTTLMLKQWRKLLLSGGAIVRPAAFACSGTFVYLAYAAHSHFAHPHVVYGYLTSAVTALSIVPYTMVLILPTNKKLLAKEEETRSLTVKDDFVEATGGEETAHVLVDRWATLNLGRTVLLAISTFSTAWTALAHDI